MDQTYMKNTPVGRLLLSMSLPMVISMTVNSLYNIVDSIFVAKISEDALTSLSLVFPLQNLMTAIAIGFGVGINSAISVFLGMKKQREANSAAALGTVMSIVHGIIMTAVFIPIMPHFLSMFTSSPAVIRGGVEYSFTVFLFSTVFSLGLAFEKILQALGKMTVTMISMLAGSATNLILDPILIFGIGPIPAMGISGAALATGIGQTVTLLFFILFMAVSKLNISLSPRKIVRAGFVLRRLYAVSIPAALNLALPSLLISALNAVLAAFSQVYVIILGAYYKMQTFLYLPANGIIQGMRPIMGYNFGAGERRRTKKIYRLTLGAVAAIMAVGTLLCLIIPRELIGCFSENSRTLNEGAVALRIICAGFIVSSVSVTASGALEAIGKGLPSLLISLMRYTVLPIPLALILSRAFGAYGVFAAFPITELITAPIAQVIYKKSAAMPAAVGDSHE